MPKSIKFHKSIGNELKDEIIKAKLCISINTFPANWYDVSLTLSQPRSSFTTLPGIVETVWVEKRERKSRKHESCIVFLR